MNAEETKRWLNKAANSAIAEVSGTVFALWEMMDRLDSAYSQDVKAAHELINALGDILFDLDCLEDDESMSIPYIREWIADKLKPILNAGEGKEA